MDLNRQNDDARASESDREYLDAVRETMSGGVNPNDENDGCFKDLFGFVLAAAVVIQMVMNFT